MMENDFHLSIKNHQRKIGDVRDLFRNLTNEEIQCLEKERILSEKKKKQQRELEEQQQLFEEERLRNEQQQQQEAQRVTRHYIKNPKTNRHSSYFENRMSESMNSNELNSNYEEKVIKAYDRLNREASEDFGKYLDDDDDYLSDEQQHQQSKAASKQQQSKQQQENKTPHQKSTDGSIESGEEHGRSNKRISKKLKKLSFKSKSQKSAENGEQPHLTDMCGFYQVELPPKEKERIEKIKQEQAKGGLAGLKNKIKNLFTVETDYAAPHYPQYVDYSETGPGIGDDPQMYNNYYAPRTIQAVEYNRSKIGFQTGTDYQEYYNQVDDLRRFDEEARINNFKVRPNDNVAIMDDEFNLKYTKSHKFKEQSEDSAGKPKNKFNKLTDAIKSKAKSFRT